MPSKTQRPSETEAQSSRTGFRLLIHGCLSPHVSDGRLRRTSSADSGNNLIYQTCRQVKCKYTGSYFNLLSEWNKKWCCFSSLASWLKPSSISCREWATVSMLFMLLPRCFSCLLFFSKFLQIRCSNVQHNWCDVLYQIQRDMSWVNLPLCFPCHIFSVAYVKDRRLSGGPGTSSSLFTSDLLLLSCLMTLASWNLFLTKVGHEYNLFGLLWSYFLLLLSFTIVSFDPKTFNPIFVQSKIFFPPMEKYPSLPHFLFSHPSAIASPVLLFAWPSAISEQML